MKETGIIMSGDHPTKILNGTKSQTRRVIKPQPIFHSSGQTWCGFEWKDKALTQEALLTYCPYGQVGDRLWVRETHYRFGDWNKNGWSKTGKQKRTFKAVNNNVRYSDDVPLKVLPNKSRYLGWYKRPSIHMPRWASRITLEITEVRVERLQEITWQDVVAEGLGIESGIDISKEHRYKFQRLWDSLNAKHSWESNPWCWCISFKMLDK